MDSHHATFERLFEAHHRQVSAYCARRVPSHVVDDVVADTFSVAWDKLPEVPADAGALPWLYAVAYRVINHEWRRAGRLSRLRSRSSTLIERPVEDGAERFVADEERHLVLDAASRLSEADQEILRLTLWEELAPPDAARVLGISTDAAKQRASRARRRLAGEFHRLARRPPSSRPATEGTRS